MFLFVENREQTLFPYIYKMTVYPNAKYIVNILLIRLCLTSWIDKS